MSGAHVQKDKTESRVPGFEVFVIRGTRPKIMKAAKLIYQKAGTDVSILEKVSTLMSFPTNYNLLLSPVSYPERNM